MTVNSTLSYFILGGFMQIGRLRYLYFILTAVVYISDVFLNLCMVVVICLNKSLHEPMYLFLCSLFVNALFGTSAFFPFLLVNILSSIHTITVPLCFLQVIILHVYANVEFLNLAAMSYDRYVAICFPLRYNTHMKTGRVLNSIIVLWLYSLVKVLITVSLNIRLTRCGNIIDHFFCRNNLILKLACSDITLNTIYGMFNLVLAIVVPLFLILYSYIEIILVCFSGSKETRKKAISTCAPQLASLLNFSFGCLYATSNGRFTASTVPTVLNIILSLTHLIFQPLLNPIMFGFKLAKIRNACKNLLSLSRQKDPMHI